MANKILNRLIDAGYRDEKTIRLISIEDYLSLPNITLADIAGLIALQKAIREKKIISFLAGDFSFGSKAKEKERECKLKSKDDYEEELVEI